MNKSERAKSLADDWITWLDDRRFFGPPPKKSVLAMLIEKNRSRGEIPDRPLNAELAAFHVAVVGLPQEMFLPFIRVYCGVPDAPIKALAYGAGIGRDAYYDRAHKAAYQVLRSMRSVLAMVENIGLMKQRESVGKNADKIAPDKLSVFC